LTEYISKNVISLLNKNVSKYFCSYYAGSALGLLFDRSAMDTEEEQILSFVMAMIHAQNVPLALVKTGNEFQLKKWKDQLGKEVVVGRNVYDNLLKSVTYGSVEFPLPKEVLDSLPENYIITQGIENVILPMFWYTNYKPVEVKYDETCKGIFIVCKTVEDISLEYFAGNVVLDFPTNLNEHGFIDFDMAKCWNKNHAGFKIIKRISNDILVEKPENKIKDIEEFLKKNLLRERFLFRMTEKEIKDTRKEYKERIFREFNLSIDLTLNEVKELLNFNSLQEYLWRWESY
jgi:hypothetical protein